MPDNLPSSRTPFTKLPYRHYFLIPHDTCPYQKIGQETADVPQRFRAHPTAPRAGFYHPKPDAEVIPMSDEEFASYPNQPPNRPGIDGLQAVEFRDDGFLVLSFATFEARTAFLSVLEEKTRSSLGEIGLCRGFIDKEPCFCVSVHFTDLHKSLVLRLAQ